MIRRRGLQMSADDKERQLMKEHGAALMEYSNLTSRLAEARWSLPQDEYLRAHRAAEIARLRCEKARLDLESFRAS
jgi:hypothetical protein